MATECAILQGHVITRLRELPARSVHCVVTSPPYWGLRSYGTEPQVWCGKKRCAHQWEPAGKIHKGGPAGVSEEMDGRDQSMRDQVKDIRCGDTCWICGAWRGELGLEPTPGLYKEHVLEVFREVWRVLRDDGTLWLNLGDTFASGWASARRNVIGNAAPHLRERSCRRVGGLKEKDMVGIPWMIAFALREAGWYLRSEIIWAKRCPMPESCSDRPTKAHEQIFLLTKRACYFYDEFAARETTTGNAHPRGNGQNPKSLKTPSGWNTAEGRHDADRTGRFRPKQNPSFSAAVSRIVANRNWRDVWEIASEPFPEAHYATFPTEIARRCILAGTSEGGCCAQCGAPLERVIEEGQPDRDHQRACGGDVNGEYHGEATKDFASHGAQDASAVKARILAGMREKKTVGWQRTCACPGIDTKPCTVCDPFGGSGTVGEVAESLGRNAVLIELLPQNIELIKGRTRQPGLILHP